jgi:8-oxo-dGTP pyrophosphatase MutT (NUDIX family)
MDCTGRYAVLVPLVEGPEGLSVLYEVRAASLRRQPGEICFPGGKAERGERPEDCALRETYEELSIPPAAVTLLGNMDFIAHRSGFLLTPVPGLVTEEAVAAARPNPAEVTELFTVPLAYLQNCTPLTYRYELRPQPGDDFPYEALGISPNYPWQKGVEEGPAYRWGDKVIWGLTGRVTRNLLELLGR